MSDEERTPGLSDADLLAYLDGELEEELAQEIERLVGVRSADIRSADIRSADIRRRLQTLAQEERRLAAGLYRGNCPDSHELGEYHMQLLAAERARPVAQHVDICPHCAMELDELRATLREMAPDLETSFVERVRVLIARLVPDLPSFGGGPVPALAGIRGDAGGPLLYEAGEVQISLEVQDDAGAAGRKSVLGLVTGGDSEGRQATLWLEDGPLAELVQTQEVDEMGNFVFEGLLPGRYSLTLRGADDEVVIQDLTVS